MKKDEKELGKRITGLRTGLRMSQQNLADQIGISRSALSQIERGERKLSAEELVRLAETMNLSAEAVMDASLEPQVILEKARRKKKNEPIRINVPAENVRKFKEVLLYILNRVGAKPNIGETVLYKLLYFIDFDYYEKYEDQLIGAKYMKNKFGPTPVAFKKIVEQMIRDKEIEQVKSRYFQRDQKKYLPLRSASLTILNARELELIDDVLNRLSDMSATKISEYSHRDVPWLSTGDGDLIEYESVFYRTDEYTRRAEDD
ncbi:MAG TPA: DUF4065 domain-containing protein [Thermoanaerobaculia bacterium]|nr:DUF4065 domain-containing protein [Thermoanaerobaculia bacterium]HUM31093.1 DUF4065 domain-containing protein [Thermoanaerobaculia bacterium]HXK69449.1 DUF4065 domain-containing protein [Thermoanaerobaculia bacterium]